MVRMKYQDKKPTSLPKDKEIGKKQHDDLLVWLGTNIGDISEWLWGKDDAWLMEQEQKARKDLASNLQALIESYDRSATNSEYSARLKSAFAKKAEEVRHLQSILSIKAAPVSLCSAKVTKWNTEFEVHEYIKDRQGRRQERLVGYVDLCANVSLPTQLRLRVSDNEPHTDHRIYMMMHADDSTTVRLINEAGFYQPKWVSDRSSFDIMFDVRAHIPSVGNLLQELKTLRRYSGSGSVIYVVCNQMDQQWVDILRHEEFGVLQKSVYER